MLTGACSGSGTVIGTFISHNTASEILAITAPTFHLRKGGSWRWSPSPRTTQLLGSRAMICASAYLTPIACVLPTSPHCPFLPADACRAHTALCFKGYRLLHAEEET